MQKLYDKDTMSSERRIRAAIHLQEPDRVPVSPLIYYFAAHYAGMTNYDLFDPKKYNQAIDKVYYELGPWDAYYFLQVYDPELVAFLTPMKSKEPGYELPPESIRQFVEEGIMEAGDYEWLIKISEWNPRLAYLRFYSKLIPRIYEHVDVGWRGHAYMIPRIIRYGVLMAREFREWRKRGVTLLYAVGAEAPFDTFSLARGLTSFVRDTIKHPDEVAEAADALVDACVLQFMIICRVLGIRRGIIDVHRSSNDFISPDMFRRLSFPSLKMMVEKLAAVGIDTILHLDGNWDLNLEILRELPAGRVVAQFDGRTDIFRAKEIIGDRICIYGDVPPEMLALDEPVEVDEYCHRLIEEVGKGGGFILGSGCEVAPNAKPENVKAMLQAAEKYGYY
jgi:uroporphyrinogen-III decarboxylase